LSLFSRPIFIVFLFYSFWWPQIVWNVYNGTKNALHPLYLYGMTISRLFLPLYLIGCPKNFLMILYKDIIIAELNEIPQQDVFFHSDFSAYFLIFWLFLQVVILQLQSIYGSRFFIPKRYLPYRYDYKRPIPTNLLSGTHSHHNPAAAAAAPVANPVHANNTHVAVPTTDLESNNDGTVHDNHECVICYNPIDSLSNNNSNDYMVSLSLFPGKFFVFISFSSFFVD
jgi:hypothetical protein